MSQNRRKRSRNRNRATTTDVKGQTRRSRISRSATSPRSTRSSSGGIQRRSPSRSVRSTRPPIPRRWSARSAGCRSRGTRRPPNTGSRWSTNGRRCLPVPWPLPEDSSMSPTRSDQRSVVQGVLLSSPLADCPVG